jgi:hypothetical protein
MVTDATAHPNLDKSNELIRTRFHSSLLHARLRADRDAEKGGDRRSYNHGDGLRAEDGGGHDGAGGAEDLEVERSAASNAARDISMPAAPGAFMVTKRAQSLRHRTQRGRNPASTW